MRDLTRQDVNDTEALDHQQNRQLTILIVDDEEPVRRYVDRVFQMSGYATAVASSGAEAIQLASNLRSLDVLITDMMMPEMCGDEVARRLRSGRPSLRVLYITGHSDRLFQEKITLWEDEAFIEKPCTASGLLEAVSLLTDGTISCSVRPEPPESLPR